MSGMRSWVATTLFVTSCVVFLLYGFINQRRVYGGNKCKMTYSQPQYERIDVDTRVKEYQLYIHGSVDTLNPTPVLFIPGNSGSAKQVRSFASNTHNSDENFQYFAVHFGPAMSATHGSIVLKQAVFVNDVLSTILALYEGSTGVSGPVEVILLAHSAGGMVSRTALLLSNHPHHSVSSIIMLGSPNARPTYTPDVTLDVLYKRVNLAWRRSMYHTTTACQAAILQSRGMKHGDVPSFLEKRAGVSDAFSLVQGNDSEFNAVHAAWDCSVNVPRTRVVSISGGEIDMEVPTPITSLAALAPRPQNISAETPVPRTLSSFFRPEGGYVRWLFRTIFFLPRYVVGLADSLFQRVMGPNVNTKISVGNESNSSLSSENSTIEESNSTCLQTFKRMEEIPQDHWDLHIMPYTEPQHVSVRTSMLAGVGFPVDHKALLWCHQVVQTTTRIMTRLSKIPTDETISGATLNSKIVKLKSSYVLPSWPTGGDVDEKSSVVSSTCRKGDSDVPIAAVQEELLRNASKHFFSHVALDDERAFLFKSLNYNHEDVWSKIVGSLSVLSLALITSHIPTVVTCYVIISLLVIATFVLYFASVRNKWSVTTMTHLYNERSLAVELSWLLPEHHLCLGSFVDLNVAILPSSLCTHFIGGNGKGAKGLSTPALILVVGASSAYIARSASNPIDFIRYNGLYAQWIVSYGVALALQCSVVIAVHTVRHVFSRALSLISTILRSTIWCKPVRNFVRPPMKPIKRKCQQIFQYLPAVEWILLVMVLSAMVVGLFLFNGHNSGPEQYAPYLGRLVLATAIMLLFGYALFVLVLATAIIWPRPGSSRMLTPMIALSLPGVLLGLPSLRFCFDVLQLSQHSYMSMSAVSALVDAFGPELINNALMILAMMLNLLFLQRYESKVYPVAFLYDIFELSKKGRASIADGNNVSNDGFMSAIMGGNDTCMHEDGGEIAVFEENKQGVTSYHRGSVLLGPSLRVVSCNCSLNKKLKSFGEWCEWCRCNKCGGKVISSSMRARAGASNYEDSYFDSSARTSLGMRDVNSDLFVLATLILGVGYSLFSAAAEPFRLFTVVGAVSAVMCAGRVCRYFGY